MIKAPIAALVIVVALLGGFYGGYKIGGGGTASAAASSGTAAGTGTGRGGGAFAAAACPSPGATAAPSPSGRIGRGTSGTVTNLTATSMTVHDTRCNTDVKVTFSSTVIVRKTVVGQAADLQENQTVTVVGARQPDGTVKANSIQIVPAGTGGGGFGGGAAAGG